MMAPSQREVTELLLAWGQGQESALQQLVPLVHQELKRLARRYMAGERPDHTLQTTALVNEAYMRLVDCQRVDWQDRAHFFAISARMMRRILVDYARSRGYQKRGGRAQRITLEEGVPEAPQPRIELMALDEALEALSQLDARKSRVVELRFFGGLSAKETAKVLDVSEDTVLRDWRLAKVWLLRKLDGRDKG
jgi:RNA polymerase sigma factor (TIGR02999 family)